MKKIIKIILLRKKLIFLVCFVLFIGQNIWRLPIKGQCVLLGLMIGLILGSVITMIYYFRSWLLNE